MKIRFDEPIGKTTIQEKEKFIAATPTLDLKDPRAQDFKYLYTKYSKEKQINLQPQFQRDFIWNQKKQKELIKSIWQGIPLPMFYFAQTRGGELEVIDGQQRLTVLFGFYNKNSLPKEIRGRIFKQIKITQNGNKVLDSEIRKKMERDLALHCVIFDETKNFPARKYEIFRKLNQGATALKPQEIRNCLLQSELAVFNKRIRKLARFLKNKFNDNKANFERMNAEELVLRYFVIRKFGYEKRVSEYINFSVPKRFEEIKKSFSDEKEINKYSNEFKRFIERMHQLFGQTSFYTLSEKTEKPRVKSDFRAYTFSRKLNQGLFHLFSCYFPEIPANQFNRVKPKKFRDNFLELLQNKQFVKNITGSATDQTSKIKASKYLFEKKFIDKCLPKKERRNISREEKKVLFINIPYCYLCYGKLNKIGAAEHIASHSGGSKSNFRNILLAHRKCNGEKLNRTLEDYRTSKKLMRRIRKNRVNIQDYLKALRKWNKRYRLGEYRKLVKYAKEDLRRKR